MADETFSKSKAQSALRQMGMSYGEHSSSSATRSDIYELKLLMAAGLQQNGELIAAFNRVADALEKLAENSEPDVKKHKIGKAMKLDGQR